MAVTVGSWLQSFCEKNTGVAAIESGLLDELREDLENAALSARLRVDGCGRSEALLPLRLPKSRLADLDSCERRAVASADREVAVELSGPMLAGMALDLFVAHWLYVGRSLEPVADLIAMLEASGEDQAREFLGKLDPLDAASLVEPVAAAAEAWADVDPRWRPRTESRVVLSLAAGAVICAGRLDVMLGGPGTSLPGVIVETKSGVVTAAHAQEVYLYALLVALRDGEAPAVVARWYPGADPAGVLVTEGVLRSSARRLQDALVRWADLSTGEVPAETAGRWCDWCPEIEACPSAKGQRRPSGFEGVHG